MTSPDAIQVGQPPVAEGYYHRNRLAIGAMAGLALVSGLVIHNRDSGANAILGNTPAGAVSPDCNTLQFSNGAADVTRYGSESFLPTNADVKSNADVAPHIKSLFKDGPLSSSKADLASFAAVEAIIAVPSHQGTINNPNYSYVGTFKDKVAAYQSANGHEVAVKDCNAMVDTLSQVASFTSDFAEAGQKITIFTPIHDVNNTDPALRNNVVGMDIQEGLASETLQGVQYKLGQATKGLKGFTPVLEATNQDAQGELIVAGFVKSELEAGTSPTTEKGQQPTQTTIAENGKPTPVSPEPSTKPTKVPANSTANAGSSGPVVTNSGTGGGNGKQGANGSGTNQGGNTGGNGAPGAQQGGNTPEGANNGSENTPGNNGTTPGTGPGETTPDTTPGSTQAPGSPPTTQEQAPPTTQEQQAPPTTSPNTVPPTTQPTPTTRPTPTTQPSPPTTNKPPVPPQGCNDPTDPSCHS